MLKIQKDTSGTPGRNDYKEQARGPGKTGGRGGRFAAMIRISIKGLAFSVNGHEKIRNVYNMNLNRRNKITMSIIPFTRLLC